MGCVSDVNVRMMLDVKLTMECRSADNDNG
jgi:hypothetical protein